MKKSLLTLTFTLFFTPFLHAQNFNLQLRSEVSYNYPCASIWGYVQDDREYALVGTYEGVSIVNVTDPDNPVELFNVNHTQSQWREIKTFSHYAYATNEDGGGMLILDLQYLPDTVLKYTFTYTSGNNNTDHSHTLWIDENGRLFLFGGSTYMNGGAVIFDLTADPLHPSYLGEYQDEYIHDGFVRGDTLWASEIFAQPGQEEVIDVSDPANPVPLVSWVTPSAFTHNAWPTHDNHYVFTTDEVDNSYLTSYDVSDFGNVTELDREQSNPGSGTVIHNVHLYNDQFAVVAYYKDGVVLFDVSHPDNMIECGSYDTDPGQSGGGYGGTWGVYPYLPSGNIIASDLYDAGGTGKLSVLTPTYVTACWLTGTVTDSLTGVLLNNVYVEIESTQNTDNSDLSGVYKTGNGVGGTYTVRFSKFGYMIKEVQNVALTSGVETILDAQLVPLVLSAFSGQVVDSITNDPIQGATVFFNSIDGLYQYSATSDANGNFSFNGYQSTYNIYTGRWSYHEKGLLGVVVNPNPPPFLFKLKKGYYDDFFFNFGWLSIGGNAFSGKWIRDEPIGTSYYGYDIYNPYNEIPNDWGDNCYMTGNLGGEPGTSDVDGDVVTLTSPVFDLTGYNEPYINFYTWWVNGGIFGPPDDTLRFTLSNGNTTVPLMNLTSDLSNPSWVFYSFKISDFITPTNNMKLKLSTVDYDGNGNANWIEGGLDVFEVVDSVATGIAVSNMNHDIIDAYPNPFSNEATISYHFEQLRSDARMDMYDVLGNKLESLIVENASGTLSFGKNLPEGVYFIHFVQSNKTLGVMKVVKQI